MLRTEPSFSIYNSEDGCEEGNERENLIIEKLRKGNGDLLERSITIGDSIEEGRGSGEFSFGKEGMGLIEEEKEESLSGFKNLGIEEEVEPVSPPMYLATGFGVDGNGIGGGGVELKPTFYESEDVEEYYSRMINEDPSNPLFLRNYGQLLQSKGDLLGAEEYYFRATLVDPKDGEMLLEYAKLVWELHHDQDRALSYFESAARAAPEDSHVLAAYASFLWEIDEGDDVDSAPNGDIQIGEKRSLVELQNSAIEEEEDKRPVSPPLHLAAGLGIDVAGSGVSIGEEGGNVEEYHKRMVEENPCNPLFLRNYGQFLLQFKGDPQGAEEYYSRAIQADPGDGEVISQYAKLVWELHHDQHKALCYFERAVQAAPGDSHVLAAYARFLWESEEDEEHSGCQDDMQLPVFQGGAVTSAKA